MVPVRLLLVPVRRLLDLLYAHEGPGALARVAGTPRVAVVVLAVRVRVRYFLLFVVRRAPTVRKPRPAMPLLPPVATRVRAAGRVALIGRVVAARVGPPGREATVRPQKDVAALARLFLVWVVLPMRRRMGVLVKK